MYSATITKEDSKVSASIKTKELLSTPYERHFHCTLEEGLTQSLSAWGRSFANTVHEESEVSRVVLHFYLQREIVSNPLYTETKANVWGTAFRQISIASNEKKETFLKTETYIFNETDKNSGRITLGFTHNETLVTTSAFVLVRIDKQPVEIVNLLRDRFKTGYNSSKLVIHLNFADFESVVDVLETIGLKEFEDFICVDIDSKKGNYDFYRLTSWAIGLVETSNDQIKGVRVF